MEPYDGIVCIGQTAWEGNFQKAVVQLMTSLSARHRVLYVDYAYTYKDAVMRVVGHQPTPVRASMRLTHPLVKKNVGPNRDVYVWTPPLLLPVNWLSDAAHDTLLRRNSDRLVKGIRRAMAQLGIKRPLVINAFNPVLGVPMLGKLNEWATIYYCFDEITVAYWMGRHGGRYEQQYMPRVDAVVTTSEPLLETKRTLQPNTYCVKNGVNFELFNQAVNLRKEETAADPVIGYLGAVDNRMDSTLVEYCVEHMPDVQFRFIGEVYEVSIRERLSKYLNVQFIPPHQPAELPPLLASLSAAMIPFVRNEHTYTIYPLKINEYLAAGLPVVSTNFSVLDDFNGVIELANEPDEFVKALRRALTDTTLERQKERVALARHHSWDRRAEEFETIIGQIEHLPNGPGNYERLTAEANLPE